MYETLDVGAELILGDMRVALWDMPENSVDAIITDPPYPHEYLHLYADLAFHAARVLRPGGVLAAMSGQVWLPNIFALVSGKGLTYRWTMAYLGGGQSAKVWNRHVIPNWKPIVVYSKGEHGKKWFGDVAKSPANDKRFHHWGQSLGGMVDILERLTDVGQKVLDPFMGAGATGVACALTHRAFVGIEVDPGHYNTAKERILLALHGGDSGQREA